MSLSTSQKLKVELRGHTALITIDNPGANTWDEESLPALKELVATPTIAGPQDWRAGGAVGFCASAREPAAQTVPASTTVASAARSLIPAECSRGRPPSSRSPAADRQKMLRTAARVGVITVRS